MSAGDSLQCAFQGSAHLPGPNHKLEEPVVGELEPVLLISYQPLSIPVLARGFPVLHFSFLYYFSFQLEETASTRRAHLSPADPAADFQGGFAL